MIPFQLYLFYFCDYNSSDLGLIKDQLVECQYLNPDRGSWFKSCLVDCSFINPKSLKQVPNQLPMWFIFL